MSIQPSSHDTRYAIRLLLPWLVGTFVLVFVPMAASTLLSFVRWDGIELSDANWIATDHYELLLGIDDKQPANDNHPQVAVPHRSITEYTLARKALWNSLVFAINAAPLNVAFALFLAVILDTPLRFIGVYRALVYLPHVLGGVATILIWSWVFNPTFGPVNTLLRFLYDLLDPMVGMLTGQGTSQWLVPGWLSSETWCKPAVIVIHAWTAGGSVFVFLASLQGVSPETRSASLLDGASTWKRFIFVTLPQLTPAILFNLVTGFAAAMQSFNYSYLLYNRDQNDGLLFAVLYIYRCAFEPPYRIGYASAVACTLFVILFSITGCLIASGRKWVHYET